MKKGAIRNTIIIAGSVFIAALVSWIIYKNIQRKSARESLKSLILKQSNLNLADAFNETRWKKSNPQISDAAGRVIAQSVNDSIGLFSEDESAITKAFYAVKNYDDLSVVAYQYRSLFGRSLYNDLLSAYKGDAVDLALLRATIAKKVNYK